MSWESRVRAALQEENPLLKRELIRSGEIEQYVTDAAEAMRQSYELATRNVTDPVRRSEAKEVAIAQMREEIVPAEPTQPILP